MKKRTTKPLSGGARLMASGKSPMTLGLDPDQRDRIKRAADIDGRPMAQFVLHYALMHADFILDKSRKKT